MVTGDLILGDKHTKQYAGDVLQNVHLKSM